MFVDSAEQLGIVTVNAVAPSAPIVGSLWLNSTTGALSTWNGTAWVASGGAAGTGNPVVSGLAHDSVVDLTLADGTVITINTLPIVDGGRY